MEFWLGQNATIIISARYRGPELKGSRVASAVAAAMKAMTDARAPMFGGSLGQLPHVNTVFVVEGSLGPPSSTLFEWDRSAARRGAFRWKLL